jgi:hypothetical protein
MMPVGIAAASGVAIAKLLSMIPLYELNKTQKPFFNVAYCGILFTLIPTLIALGVSAKIAAVVTASFYLSAAYFGVKDITTLYVACRLTCIGGAITYVTLASFGPIIAGAIGIAGGIAGALLG